MHLSADQANRNKRSPKDDFMFTNNNMWLTKIGHTVKIGRAIYMHEVNLSIWSISETWEKKNAKQDPQPQMKVLRNESQTQEIAATKQRDKHKTTNKKHDMKRWEIVQHRYAPSLLIPNIDNDVHKARPPTTSIF